MMEGRSHTDFYAYFHIKVARTICAEGIELKWFLKSNGIDDSTCLLRHVVVTRVLHARVSEGHVHVTN